PGQIVSYQPPCEPGRAEHHHVQLTIPAHPLILKKHPDGPARQKPARPPQTARHTYHAGATAAAAAIPPNIST
ncbi:MAG TPA: hypothetical protein VN255_12265, partial [Mycobacterium sp.]|nr:hypothetical protein [Mycobacterium sp.]